MAGGRKLYKQKKPSAITDNGAGLSIYTKKSRTAVRKRADKQYHTTNGARLGE